MPYNNNTIPHLPRLVAFLAPREAYCPKQTEKNKANRYKTLQKVSPPNNNAFNSQYHWIAATFIGNSSPCEIRFYHLPACLNDNYTPIVPLNNVSQHFYDVKTRTLVNRYQ